MYLMYFEISRAYMDRYRRYTIVMVHVKRLRNTRGDIANVLQNQSQISDQIYYGSHVCGINGLTI